MSSFQDFLVKAVLPIVQAVGQSKLIEVLQKLHDTDNEKYQATVIAGHAFIKPLIAVVANTENTIDDGLVAAINEAIEESAKANGVVFPA